MSDEQLEHLSRLKQLTDYILQIHNGLHDEIIISGLREKTLLAKIEKLEQEIILLTEDHASQLEQIKLEHSREIKELKASYSIVLSMTKEINEYKKQIKMLREQKTPLKETTSETPIESSQNIPSEPPKESPQDIPSEPLKDPSQNLPSEPPKELPKEDTPPDTPSESPLVVTTKDVTKIKIKGTIYYISKTTDSSKNYPIYTCFGNRVGPIVGHKTSDNRYILVQK
jgi:hypothetical protein